MPGPDHEDGHLGLARRAAVPQVLPPVGASREEQRESERCGDAEVPAPDLHAEQVREDRDAREEVPRDLEDPRELGGAAAEEPPVARPADGERGEPRREQRDRDGQVAGRELARDVRVAVDREPHEVGDADGQGDGETVGDREALRERGGPRQRRRA